MHINKQTLIERTKMSDLEAARWMNSLRNSTYANGGKVVRIIRDGVVTDQYVGGVPKYGKIMSIALVNEFEPICEERPDNA